MISSARRPAALVALVAALTLAALSAAGCKGFQPADSDGGPGGDGSSTTDGGGGDDSSAPPPMCTSTSVRAFQPLGGASQYSYKATLGYTGKRVAIVFENAAADHRGTLLYAEVDDAGVVVAGPKQLTSGREPHIAALDGALRLFYRDNNKRLIMADLVDGALKNAVTLTSTLEGGFDLDWDGSRFGIALTGPNGRGAPMVYFLAVDKDGKGLGPLQRVPKTDYNALQPTIAALAEGRFIVAWTEAAASPPELHFRLLDKLGKPQGEPTRASTAGIRGSFGNVTRLNRGGAVLCFQERVAVTNQEVYCTRIDDAGKVVAKHRLTNTINDSINPRVVAHGDGAWVVYNDHTVGAVLPTIHYQFLDRAGSPLLEQPVDSKQIAGWRPWPLVRSEALYVAQYTAETTTKWVATAGLLNCF